jgi:signal transduction histidine kinase
MAAGVPFELALMPMAIGNACAMIRLGLVFLRELKPEDAASSAKWVGGSAVALALWPFIFPYPLLVHTSLAWFGYAGSGLLQIVWGTGMALYLIEVSWLRYQRAQEQIAQVKNDIVSIVSHELRSPLTAAIGYAEFLDEELAGPLNEAQREYLAEIQKGHRRLRRLVDDLLDFSLAESRALKLDRREADLGDLVQAVVESFRLQAQRAGVRLELERPTEPLRAQVDPERIEQVITNLVDNALKFTPEGGAVRVAIRAEGTQRIVEVSDDGMGIDPADLPHLFDKFFQAHGGPRRVRGGAGLGLAVAKAIVEAHGGGIAVASDPGEGTCFAVALPAEVPSASALQPEAASEAMTS